MSFKLLTRKTAGILFGLSFISFLLWHYYYNQSMLVRYNICIISRFKNSGYLLPQWIQFHALAGVNHFFLVDDCSSSDRKREHFLNDCSKKGYCTIETGSNSCANEKKHLKMLFSKYGNQCLWTAVIDADEYIFPQQFNPGDTSLFFLRNLLQNTSDIIFRMPWYILSTKLWLRKKTERFTH